MLTILACLFAAALLAATLANAVYAGCTVAAAIRHMKTYDAPEPPEEWR